MPGRTTSEEDVLWLFLFYRMAMKKKMCKKHLTFRTKGRPSSTQPIKTGSTIQRQAATR